MARSPLVATYSIAACDLDAGPVGRRDPVEVPRGRLGRAVGRAGRRARSRRRRTPTRATARTGSRCSRDGLERRRRSVDRLTAADDDREHRQLGVVDAHGGSATFTGGECMDWAGGLAGPCFAAQGNILVGAETVDGARRRPSTATAGRPLAERLLECLAAAQAAGGDRRGQQSAALLVVERDGGYAGLSDVLVDLRVDDHEQPVAELARLLRDPRRCSSAGRRRAEWVEVDDALRRGARASGCTRSATRASSSARSATGPARENLEERVDGVERIDPVVLAELRAR